MPVSIDTDDKNLNVVNKLLYLSGTKEKIKDALNKFGAELTNKNTFRSYADIIYNLYDRLPTTEEESSNITLNNTLKAKLKTFEVEGKSEQNSYSGKNLLNLSNIVSQTLNGITFTPVFDDNGCLLYINASGTASNTTFYKLYTGSFSNNEYIYHAMYNEKTGVSSYTADSNDNRRTDNGNGVTIPSSYSIATIWIRINNGTTMDNYKFYPMLRLASIEDDTYEPYVGGIASPSPDYPQEVKSVSGTGNLVDTSGNPDYLYRNTSYEKNGDNIIVKMLTNSVYAFVQYYIDDLKPNTTYTISFDAVSTNNGFISADVMKNRDGSQISDILVILDRDTSGHVSGQFTTPSDTSAMSINLYSLRGTYYENASVEYSNIQIEEGTVAHQYVPYGHWLPVKVSNKNLFDINRNINTSGGDGSQTSYNSVSNGILTTTVNSITTHAVGQKYTNLNGKTITFSADVVSVGTSSSATPRTGIAIYDNGTFITSSRVYGIVGDRITTTYTCTSNNIVCGFLTLQGTGGQYKNIQVEISNEKTDYVERQEQTTLIDLNKENLFDKDNVTDVDGFFTSTNSTITSYSGATIKSIYIPCQPNKTYTISKISSSRFAVGYTTTLPDIGVTVYDSIGGTSTKTSYTLKTGSDAKYLIAFVYFSNSDTTTYDEILDSIKIFEGSNATPYYELCSIKDETIKDLLTIKNGKAVLNKNITNIVLNGSENWRSRSQISGDYYRYENLDFRSNDCLINSEYISDKFSYTTDQSLIGNYIENTTTSGANRLWVVINASLMDGNTIENFKTWLSTHNTEVYYALATPETITLKGTYNLKTYEEVTHIEILDDLEPSMRAVALLGNYNSEEVE